MDILLALSIPSIGIITIVWWVLVYIIGALSERGSK